MQNGKPPATAASAPIGAATQHSTTVQNALRMASSGRLRPASLVRQQTGVIAARQFTFARWALKARNAGLPPSRSVRGVDRPHPRATVAARVAAAWIAAHVIKGVLDAVE